MSDYRLPEIKDPVPVGANEAILVASGDLRLSANQTCWPAQEDMERRIVAAFAAEGITVKRGHPYDPVEKHGFISSQRMGMDVFKNIHPDARLIVAEAVWQYSHHVLAGLRSHRGPILTVANWSGEWPGLVGMLNLNGSLTKAGTPYSTIWSRDFTDEFFLRAFANGLKKAKSPTMPAMYVTSIRAAFPRPKPAWAARWRCSFAARRPSWASSTRAAWACTTPSSMMKC